MRKQCKTSKEELSSEKWNTKATKKIIKMIKRILAVLACFTLSLQAIVVIDNPPSDALTINVSNRSVNRLVLPSQILDVSFSKEKLLASSSIKE